MTLSNSVYLQMMQSVKEKTIKREFEVKEEDVVNDDAFIGATYHLGGNGLKEKVLKGILDEEVYKFEFDCIDEAETFYNMLARVAGFSIRKDDLKQDKNGDIISRKWVCSREGQRATKFIENDKRQREPRSLTRVGCEAAFRVGLNRKNGKWIVKEFIGDHNHNLVDAINTQFLRTNAYKKPLVVLVGVNHHHQTVVFGCALLIDESVGTYEWVLETFLDAMMNKKPISVVTDGDKAMRLLKHICNVHVHGVGMKKNLKRAILRIRQKEAKAEFESNNSSPVLSTKLSILENHIAMVYTKESFLKFREEMKNVELFFVVGLVEHLEEIPQSCIMKRWTKLAKVYTRSVPVNETDNNMDRFVRYGKKIASDGATGTNQVRDPNIVKTKGNPGKVAMNVQKGRRCSRCKRVGHTIRKCPEATIPQNAQPGYMGMLGEQLPNDPSDMYIDWGELNNIAGFQQHEQSMSTPCEGGDPNKYPNEKDMQPFFLFLNGVRDGRRQPIEEIPQPVEALLTSGYRMRNFLNRLRKFLNR
ncbi:Protein FAR1-related sequence 5 [Vitis vinifera]|uniref:Protein FAR1-related sequence 5 n=1 Tax=Vitis vinifera TaxID=29760 RepID=A0A438D0X4_VITVI|nr:Protein FAR1-related sequence 5 [Vitis vinifera]